MGKINAIETTLMNETMRRDWEDRQLYQRDMKKNKKRKRQKVREVKGSWLLILVPTWAHGVFVRGCWMLLFCKVFFQCFGQALALNSLNSKRQQRDRWSVDPASCHDDPAQASKQAREQAPATCGCRMGHKASSPEYP